VQFSPATKVIHFVSFFFIFTEHRKAESIIFCPSNENEPALQFLFEFPSIVYLAYFVHVLFSLTTQKIIHFKSLYRPFSFVFCKRIDVVQLFISALRFTFFLQRAFFHEAILKAFMG
jgi:hypothetical protein